MIQFSAAALVLTFLALCSSGPAASEVSGGSPARPNIVVIMADDLGFSDIGCYGGEIRTPNLDRLAANGLRYTQFYNAAKCHTSRAALMAGIYPHRTGCELPLTARAAGTKEGKVKHSGVSIASVLRGAGYATFASGKWHAGGKPLERGFDHFFGLPGGACSFFTPARSLQRDRKPVSIGRNEDFYFTDAISEQAVDYLDGHFGGETEHPVFLYVAYTAPHWPLHALEEDIARYAGRYAAGWQAVREERRQRLVKAGMIRPEWKLPPMEPEKDWKDAEHAAWDQRRMEVYAAQVDRMDQGIGRILGALEKHGQWENTLIMFLSDNGGSQEEIRAEFGFVQAVMSETARDGRPIGGGNDPSIMPGPEHTFQSVGHDWGNTSNTPFRYGKVRVHEGGIASPLVVHWPAGIRERGGLRRQTGHVIDLLPTCIEVTGGEYPDRYRGTPTERLDGISLVPTFDDHPLDRDTIFFEMGGNRAVRSGKWKAVTRQGLSGKVRNQVRVAPEFWELYDMENDRTETANLADRHPEILSGLIERWERWIEN